MNDQGNNKPENTNDSAQIDQLKFQGFMSQARDDQNLSMGILAGIVAAVLGAVAWAIVTALTNYQIGWMAVGVGFLVGFSIRQFGKGFDSIFGISGAVLSLVGCLLGNLLTVCIVISRQESVPFVDLLTRLNPAIAIELMKVTFSPIDLLFYGIAVYEGYKLSFRRISEEEIGRLTNT